MKRKIVIAVAAISLFAACTEKNTDLAGSGATFPQPYYNLAFKNFQEKGDITISYGGIGSGGGIRGLKSQVSDFAGSDAYLSDEEKTEMPTVIHIPTCLGAVVMSYNLKEVKELKLTSSIISGIFLGKITRWNDPAIAAVNNGIVLPNKAITPVYRSDGSGTTYVFSDYMTKSDSTWSKELGRGKSLNFNTGIAGKGNPGVVGVIGQTDGSIGYIGSEYAFSLNLPVAQIQNKNGEFISPNATSISASASGQIPDDLRYMITNSSAQGAYPISCLTWILVYQEQAYGNRTEKQAAAIVKMLDYMISEDAQKLTSKVHYAPLPKEVIEKSKVLISKITFNGKPINK